MNIELISKIYRHNQPQPPDTSLETVGTTMCQKVGYLCEGPCEPPEAAEADLLQIGELLLGGVLARDHVLDDALHRVQDGLVMTQRQHAVYLSIQQRMAANT